MRIPVDFLEFRDVDAYITRWQEVADQLSMEYGIPVGVHIEYDTPVWTPNSIPTRIYFKIDDHEFEGLQTLKKALSLKAFL